MKCAKMTRREARYLADKREERTGSTKEAKELAVEIMKERGAKGVVKILQTGYTCGSCGCTGQVWLIIFNNSTTYEFYTTDIYGSRLMYAFSDFVRSY